MALVKDDILAKLKQKGIGVQRVSDDLGIARNTIYYHLNRNPIDKEFISKIGELYKIDFSTSVIDKLPNWGNIGEQLGQIQEPPAKYLPTKIGGGIPMYNVPASASDVEMYQDERDVQIIGYLNMPGAVIGSFSLPVHGHSMYPTLENGNWCVVRPIKETSDIDWGEIYFVQYGDYRVFKRLLKGDNPDTVTLWSDNQSEVIMGRPKYAAKTIRVDRIRKLCIVTDILKKPNY